MANMREPWLQFCENVANGMSHTQAYMSVYGTKRDVAKVNAVKLFRKPEIKEKINEIKLRKSLRMDWTYQDSESALMWAVEYCKQTGNVKDLVAAVKELNNMGGFKAPEKHLEIKATVETQTIDDVLKNVGYIRTDEPRRLSENCKA